MENSCCEALGLLFDYKCKIEISQCDGIFKFPEAEVELLLHLVQSEILQASFLATLCNASSPIFHFLAWPLLGDNTPLLGDNMPLLGDNTP